MPLSTKMKILITLPLLSDPGGVASYYNSILPYMKQIENLEIVILEIGSSHGKNSYSHPILDQIRFIKRLLSVKPDIVHINPSLNFPSFIRDGLFLFWAKRLKIPVIVFFHGWQRKFENKIKGLLKVFFNFTYKKADSFIVLATEFRDKLCEWEVRKPIHQMTTSVDESLLKGFSIQKKMAGVKQSNPIRLLFLSRLEKEKGVFETIDAFKLLLDEQYEVTLTIAGDGSIKKETHEYVTRLGLREKVFMPGYIRGDEKRQTFIDHDIYCFPTYYGEGMPTSVLEAMAFGMPVVTTRIGGIKDFFENAKMGYLSESPHPIEIAECIKKICSDKDKLNHISYYNYRYAQQNFMASKVAKKIFTLYNRMNLA